MINQCGAAGAGHILDLLIIGGGLSGLMVAGDFHRRTLGGIGGRGGTTTSALPPYSNSSSSSSRSSWKLLEARPVLGGRLANDDCGHGIDLGGAWLWPQHQPNIRRLLAQLTDVTTFAQPDDPSSTRVDGGAVELIRALAQDLPAENIVLNAPVAKCTLVAVSGDGGSGNETLIQVQTGGGGPASIVTARRVVVAVPPKLVAKHIQFDPPLTPARQHAMESSHTWMAGVTKVSLVYRTRFWNEEVSNMGLPSHLGPAFQVYDASTADGKVAAITFFALVQPHTGAADDDAALAEQVARQIGQVWRYSGEKEMATHVMGYTAAHVKRWPLETYISEDPQPTRIHPHPHPVGALSKCEWGNRLLFAGSESDQASPGVMEGAIGAAKRVLKEIP
jgi:monoamine oxidase